MRQLTELFAMFSPVSELKISSHESSNTLLQRNIDITRLEEEGLIPIESLSPQQCQNAQGFLNKTSGHISQLRSLIDLPDLKGTGASPLPGMGRNEGDTFFTNGPSGRNATEKPLYDFSNAKGLFGSEEKKSVNQEKHPEQALEKTMMYKDKAGRDGVQKETNFRELLTMGSDELGRIWPGLSSGKYEIYKELTPSQQDVIEKNLMNHAYSKVQSDYHSRDNTIVRDTFGTFGGTLNQIPRIHAMNDKDKSETLYNHYLSFLDQNNTTWPAFKTSVDWFMRKNPVTAIKEGHGRCGEHSNMLKEMFNRAGIPADTVEAWEDVKTKDTVYRALRYEKDRNGVKGTSSVNHQSIMVNCKDGEGRAQQAVFDPAGYFCDKRKNAASSKWNHSVSWSEWVEHYHRHGWDGPLNVFVQGDNVTKDFNRESFLAPPVS